MLSAHGSFINLQWKILGLWKLTHEAKQVLGKLYAEPETKKGNK